VKVLLVTSHLNAGGITSYTLSLAKALRERGCDVVLASGGGQFVQTLNYPHFNIGIHTKCEIGYRALKGAWKMRQIIKQHKINIVHAQTRVSAVTSSIACRWTGIPYLTTAHGFYTPHLGRRIFPSWGQAVIAISSQVLEHLKRDFHVDSRKIHLIYNGTDFVRYREVPSESQRLERLIKFGLEKNRPLIGIVARLSPVKGHRYLLQAIHGLCKEQPLQCLVVGDGPSREEFLSELKRLDLESIVRWIPWVENPSEVLGLLDIFVLPSLQEGLSLSILEAQAAGVPVVASNVGGISEAVIDGETGILVPPQDSKALKTALKKILEDRQLAQRMGQTASEHIKNRFNLSRMADQVIEVYQKILRDVQ
jgi:glycosyltransferase involved in cell wall biosynthesis